MPFDSQLPPQQGNTPRTPQQKKKRRRVALIASITAIAIVVLAVLGVLIGSSALSPERKNLEIALEELSSEVKRGDGTLYAAGDLDEPLQDELDTELDNAALLHNDMINLGVFVFDLGSRVESVEDARDSLADTIDDLEVAIEIRANLAPTLEDATNAVTAARTLLSDSDGKVADDSVRDTLLTHIESLEDLIAAEVDTTRSEEIDAHITGLNGGLSEDLAPAVQAVEISMDDWEEQKALEEEESAKTDPANYNAISERDWQKMLRDADQHVGEQYVVYGYVFQSDSFTGPYGIMAWTSGERSSAWYDYEVNTTIQVDDSAILSDVVEGDTVKMLVVIAGTYSYETTDGSSANAVAVQAMDVEVIG